MAAYYKISYGTGFYEMQSYMVKVDYPTTDYGALVDILIDWLVEHDRRNILDFGTYEWSDDGNGDMILMDGFEYGPDTYVQGGNCGDILMHYGQFIIREIDEEDLDEDTEVIER